MRQKGFIILPIVIIIALVGALGYFIYQNTQLRESFRNLVSPSVVPNSSLPKPFPTSDITANWKTHTNSIYGFTFKYPSTWKDFGDGNSSGYFKTESNNTVNLVVNLDTLASAQTLAEYLQKIDKLSATDYEGGPSKQVQSTKTIQINKQNCIQREEYLVVADIVSLATYCSNKNTFVDLTLVPTPGNSLEKDKTNYDQMISTFIFTGKECQTGRYLKQCKLGPCCCPNGAICD